MSSSFLKVVQSFLELFRIDRLEKKVHCAGFQCGEGIALMRRRDYEVKFLVLAEIEKIKAREQWHVDVEEDELGLSLLDLLDGIIGIGSTLDACSVDAELHQLMLKHSDAVVLIIYNEDVNVW